MDAWGLPDEGWKPPEVQPRKEKRAKQKQNKAVRPYTETEPSPRASQEASAQDKLDRELQRPNPYTAESTSSPRPDAQEKLRRERLRLLADAGSSAQGSDSPALGSASTSNRPTSPAPTYTSLPPYTPGPSQPRPQSSREGSQAKTSSFLNRLGLTTSRRRSREPDWAVASNTSTDTRPLPTVPDAGHSSSGAREGAGLDDKSGAAGQASTTNDGT
ncbi:unnamed protein product [Peniophora sp. CBMAI 1063]|nr:unnamed protein product [Peniophora sp. CBMAI 1063]